MSEQLIALRWQSKYDSVDHHSTSTSIHHKRGSQKDHKWIAESDPVTLMRRVIAFNPGSIQILFIGDIAFMSPFRILFTQRV